MTTAATNAGLLRRQWAPLSPSTGVRVRWGVTLVTLVTAAAVTVVSVVVARAIDPTF